MRALIAAVVLMLAGGPGAALAAAGSPGDEAAAPVTGQALLERALLGPWYWDNTVEGQGFAGVIELAPDGKAAERSGGMVPSDPREPQSPPMSVNVAPREGTWRAAFADDGAAELVLVWPAGEPETYRLYSDGTLRAGDRRLFRK